MNADHYNFKYKDVLLDPYRILHTYGICHPAHQHAIKKLLRAGQSVKTLEEDINEVIDTLVRWKIMNKDQDKS